MSAPACPRCAGPFLPDHPAGVLLVQHRVQCPLLAAEDATHAADVQRVADGWGTFDRPTTDAERVLLAAAGVTTTDPPTTTVSSITAGIVRREWADPYPEEHR